MTYGGQALEVSYLFEIVGTDEIAITTLKFTTVPGWTGAVAALGEVSGAVGNGPGLYDPMEDLMSEAQLGWADYSRMTGWKLAAVGTDGRYLADPQSYEPTLKAIGTTAGVVPQCSLVISLNSGFAIGGGNRGRMYLPHCRATLEPTTPFILATHANTLANRAASTINAIADFINSAATATLFPAIMSTLGTTKGVTAIKVGNVNDTQRRRRNRLPETYITKTLGG